MAEGQLEFSVVAGQSSIDLSTIDHPIQTVFPDTGTWGQTAVYAAAAALLAIALILALRRRPDADDADVEGVDADP